MRKTKKLRSMKGITLIALVITIIVLLILAGVAISMLSGENGILNQAATAKVETERASAEESVRLAAISALTAGQGEVDLGVLNSELSKIAGEEINIESLPTTVTINEKDYTITANGEGREATEVEKYLGKEITDNKKTITDETGDTIVVPVGFKIQSNSPTLVDRGIVVEAPDGSEFVWVPVKDINSMVMCQSHSGTSDCNIVKGEDGELKCNNHANTLICGKLYGTTTGLNSTMKTGLNTQTYNATSGLREPAYTTHTTNGDASNNGLKLLISEVGIEGTVGEDDEDILETWEQQLQDEFEKMAKCVYENKGFYVGRYETSLDETTKYAQSMPGKKAATPTTSSANTWYGFYQKEKEYSKNANLSNTVISSMIWGSQYDQMLLWMESNGIDIRSKNPVNLEGVTTSKNTTKVSGPSADNSWCDKLNNIYDLLGSSTEWSLEATGDASRVLRGGYSSSFHILCHHDAMSPTHNQYTFLTSRLALYVE